MSFANVQFPFYRVILYFFDFLGLWIKYIANQQYVWPRLQILCWEFVWKEEFSRWLRCRLSFGPRPWWPISNSQGYFQLIIHLCHLDTYHRDGSFFDLQDDYHAKKSKKEIFLRRCQLKKWFQNSDPAGRLSPTVIRNRWRRAALPVDWTTIVILYCTDWIILLTSSTDQPSSIHVCWLDHQAVAPLHFSTVFGVLPLSEPEPLHIFPVTNLVDAF